MDFLSYIMSFYDYVSNNRMSSSQIALFTAIAAQCFKSGGTSVIIKNQEKLQIMAGVEVRSYFNRCLNALKQKGLIDFTKGDKWNGKEYRLLFNADAAETLPSGGTTRRSFPTVNITDSNADTTGDMTGDMTGDVTENLQVNARTRHNINNNIKNISSSFKSNGDKIHCIEYFEKVTGRLLSPGNYSSIIEFLDKGVEDELVCAAVDSASARNINQYAYVESIINKCISQDIYTADEYKKRQQERAGKCEVKQNDPYGWGGKWFN